MFNTQSSPAEIFLELYTRNFKSILRRGHQAAVKYAKDPLTIFFLMALNDTGPEGKAVVARYLATTNVVEALISLYNNRHNALNYVLTLIKDQPHGGVEQAEILASLGTVPALVRRRHVEDVLALIKAQPLERQAQILAARDVVEALVTKGKFQDVLTLIKAQSHGGAEQAKILAACVEPLCKAGEVKEVLALIKAQPLERQAKILAGDNVVWGLVFEGGAGNDALALIKAQPHAGPEQAKILAVRHVVGLLGKEKSEEVLALIDAQPPKRQQRILAAKHVRDTLIRLGQEKKVRELEAGIAEALSRPALRPAAASPAAA